MNIVVILAALVVAVVLVIIVVSRLSREAAWKQFAQELGAQYVSGGLFGSSKVLASIGQEIVTFNTYSVSTGDDSSTTYTQLRAPFQDRDHFQFTILRQGLLARKINAAIGMRDIQIGDADFDRDFVIQGTDESRIRKLLGNKKILQLMKAQPSLTVMLRHDGLHLSSKGVVRDNARLKSMFELFSEVLHQLQA